MLLNKKPSLSFDDVAILPAYSDIRSRTEVNLTQYIGKYEIKLPIFSSPMDTVTGPAALSTMIKGGGSGIIHRYCSIAEQVKMLEDTLKLCDYNNSKLYGAAIGVKDDYLKRAESLVEAGCNLLCIDVAHGHHILMKEAIEQINQKVWRSQIILMAGNIATPEGFWFLEELGVDLIRCNISGGSICASFTKTGAGIPTLQCILDIVESKYNRKSKIIADGGIKDSGHICIAIAAGADYVMCGSILAGHDENPGQIVEQNGKQYKLYRGMASTSAQEAFKGSYNSNEGVSALIPYKGSLEKTLKELDNGIRSGVSYTGQRNLDDFRESVKLIQLTNSATKQLHPHINN